MPQLDRLEVPTPEPLEGNPPPLPAFTKLTEEQTEELTLSLSTMLEKHYGIKNYRAAQVIYLILAASQTLSASEDTEGWAGFSVILTAAMNGDHRAGASLFCPMIWLGCTSYPLVSACRELARHGLVTFNDKAIVLPTQILANRLLGKPAPATS